MTRQELRAQLRKCRAAISNTQRQIISAQVAQRVSQLALFQQAQHVAAYIATAEELDPLGLLKLAFALGKHSYIPVIQEQQLAFAAWTPDTKLQANHLGIPEPVNPQFFPAEQLDLVIVPLVGFDQYSNRLGMGGGYYDRSFAFTKNNPPPPYLLGVAMQCQQHTKIPIADWDIRLHGVMTETNFYQTTAIKAYLQ